MSWVWVRLALGALWLARTRHRRVALWAWRNKRPARRGMVLVVQVLPPTRSSTRPMSAIARRQWLSWPTPCRPRCGLGAALDTTSSRTATWRLFVESGCLDLAFATCRSRSASVDQASSGRGLGASGLELSSTPRSGCCSASPAGAGLSAQRGGAAPCRHGVGLRRVDKVFLIDMAGCRDCCGSFVPPAWARR